MDRERSDDITGRMPIVAYDEITGVERCGCMIAAVEASNVELRCNECGAVADVVQIDILRGVLGTDGATGDIGDH